MITTRTVTYAHHCRIANGRLTWHDKNGNIVPYLRITWQ